MTFHCVTNPKTVCREWEGNIDNGRTSPSKIKKITKDEATAERGLPSSNRARVIASFSRESTTSSSSSHVTNPFRFDPAHFHSRRELERLLQTNLEQNKYNADHQSASDFKLLTVLRST